MELCMKKNIRVTYTLPKDVVGMVKTLRLLNEDKSYSQTVSTSIQRGFASMEESLRDNDDLSMFPKKWKNTVTKTFSIPIEMSERLSYYSSILTMKKSHLVSLSIIDFYQSW